MDKDEIECWVEAIKAREEADFQNNMSLQSMTSRHDKPGIDSRKAALRKSEYAWHDHLRQEVKLGKLRPKTR